MGFTLRPSTRHSCSIRKISRPGAASRSRYLLPSGGPAFQLLRTSDPNQRLKSGAQGFQPPFHSMNWDWNLQLIGRRAYVQPGCRAKPAHRGFCADLLMKLWTSIRHNAISRQLQVLRGCLHICTSAKFRLAMCGRSAPGRALPGLRPFSANWDGANSPTTCSIISHIQHQNLYARSSPAFHGERIQRNSTHGIEAGLAIP